MSIEDIYDQKNCNNGVPQPFLSHNLTREIKLLLNIGHKADMENRPCKTADLQIFCSEVKY
jgi:hypothetical protein